MFMVKKKRGSQYVLLAPAIVIVGLLVSSCATIAVYNEQAYQRATSLKVESLALISLADEAFSDHADKVMDLKVKVESAYEYVKGIPKNTIVTNMWELMVDPEGGLLFDFFRVWEEEGSLLSGTHPRTRRDIPARRISR